MHLKQDANGLEIINIASVYGKNLRGLQNMLNHDLLYWNNKKGSDIVDTFGLQLPAYVSQDSPLAANIKTESDLSQYQNNKETRFSQRENQDLSEQRYNQAKENGETELTYSQWKQVRSPAFKAWFGDWENDPGNASKVINPKTGEPLVVYHGTSANFNAFDPEKQENYRNQYGGGFYFTSNPDVAKLFGDNVMPVFLNARIGLAEKRLARRKGQTVERDHLRPNDSRDIWVVYNPNQVKSATTNNGEFSAENDDIRYSQRAKQNATDDKTYLELAKRYEQGDTSVEPQLRQLVDQKAKLWAKASRITDEQGNLRTVYHGTKAENLHTFDYDKIGQQGTADGQGFYFTDDVDYAKRYQQGNGKVINAYLNLENKLDPNSLTFTKKEVKSLLKHLDPTGQDVLSNYGDVDYEGYNNVLNEAAELLLDLDNDVEVIGDIINSGNDIDKVYNALSKVRKNSGIIAPKEDGSTHYILGTQNQMKSADLITYDDKGNIIPLSKRFNSRSNDIRYSLRPTNRPKSESLEKLRQAKPIHISGKDIEPSSDIRQYRKNAFEYGKTLRGVYINADTGREIKLGRSGVTEVLHHDVSNPEHLQSIAAIPQIIEQSIYIDTLPNEDKAKHPDIASYDYYLAGLNIGGNDYTVRAVIANSTTGEKYYDHKLSEIEKGDILEMTSRVSTAEISNQSPIDLDDKRLLQILQDKSAVENQNLSEQRYNQEKENGEHDYKDPEHLQSIAAIPQIIENAIYVDTLPNEDKEKHPNIQRYDYYVAGLNIGGDDYTVKAVVSTAKDGSRYYDHKLSEIKKGELLSRTSRITTPVDKSNSPFNDFDDKRLLQILQDESAGENEENIRYSQRSTNRQKFERFERLCQMKSIQISGKDIYSQAVIFVSICKNVLEYGKALRGIYINVDTGYEINLGHSRVEKRRSFGNDLSLI
ncbi:hypothetical protein [Avibacterium avium]|uniref:LPD3 domain-containing protein n=1 Tax=Avibacterium avium TaxID=751 RepID=UPI003BF879C1